MWGLEGERFDSEGSAGALPAAGGMVVGQRAQRMLRGRAKI